MAFAPRRGIVTPEAVVLEFETGGVGSRTVARAVDLGIQLTMLLFGLSAVGLIVAYLFDTDYGTAVAITLSALVGLVALLGYPIFMETRFGGTIGKLLFGLRVVTVEGGPIRLRHAAIRAFMQLVDVWLIPIGVIGVLSMLLSRQSQRLGDLAAGTVILREQSSALRSMPVAFLPPPALLSYVATLDASAVTTEQYGVIRTFLVRARQLTPDARAAISHRLAASVAARIHQQVPAWLHPEVFLVCVANAYQRRHGGHVAWS
ncbi:MAG: RDD family protein [Acidimicrobiales bacterium]